MPVTFISYRREDSGGHAGRLFDRLREQFGQDRVFLDVVGIEAGRDFVESIDKAVGSCEVLLAVIGRDWLTSTDRQGRRRLDDPNDFIRAEISAALKRDIRVVPVLVQGAEMPPTDALPEDLKRLTRRQAVELRDSRWDADVEDLIETLVKGTAVPTQRAVPPPGLPPPVRGEPAGLEAGWGKGRRGLLWGIGALVAVLIAVGAGLSLRRGGEPEPRPAAPAVGQPQTPEPEPSLGPEPQEQPDRQPAEPEPEPQRVSVPDLVGLSVDEALERLRTSGLVAGNQEAQQTGTVPARQVLWQRPRAGAQLDRGTPVDLVYAEPPLEPPVRVTVPDVVGTDVRQAMDIIRAAGFDGTRRSEESGRPRYEVLRQEPTAGNRVAKGTKVTLVYAFQKEDRVPEPAAPTVVFIHYAASADRATAEGLASYLRGLRLPVADYKVSLATRGPASTGKLQYFSAGQADLARTIAGRSGSWLSRAYGRRVSIEPDLPSASRRTSLVLWMPGR
jgi:hypothetical protein